MSNINEFGSRLRHARILAGFQRQIDFHTELRHRGIDISQSTLSKWETGQYFPDFREVATIAAILDVSLDYLAGRAELPDLLTPDERGVVVSKDVAAALEQLRAALTPQLTQEQQLALQFVEQIKGAA